MGMRHGIKCFKTLIVFSGSVALVVLISIFGPESVNDALVFSVDDDSAPDYFGYEDMAMDNQTVPRGGWKRSSTKLMPRALKSTTYENMINLLEDFHALAKKLNSTPIMNRGMLLGRYYY